MVMLHVEHPGQAIYHSTRLALLSTKIYITKFGIIGFGSNRASKTAY